MTQIDVYKFKRAQRKNKDVSERNINIPSPIQDDYTVQQMFNYKDKVLHAKCNFESV